MIVRKVAHKIRKTAQGEWKKMPPELMVVPILSGQQVYESYNKAEEKQKNKVLIRDLIVFGFTCGGIFASAHWAGKFCEKKLLHMKNNVVKIIAAPLGGILGGFLAGTIADKVAPVQYPNVEQKVQKKRSESQIADKTLKQKDKKETKKKKAKNLLTVTMTSLGAMGGTLLGDKFITKKKLRFGFALPVSLGFAAAGGMLGFAVSKPFEKKKVNPNLNNTNDMAMELLLGDSLTVVDGVNIAQAKSTQSRIRKGFYEIVAGVIAPTIVVLPVAQMIATKKVDKFLGPKLYSKFAFMDKYKNLNKNLILENAILAPLTILGVMFGRVAGDFVNKNISDRFIKKN